MGEVWEALRQLGGEGEQRVALKRIRTERARDPSARELFRQEGQIGLDLSHSSIVKVFDLDAVDGELVIVMEYVDGLSLDRLVCAEPLGFELVRHILRGMLGGLACMHRHGHGIIHRDVTPRNVMVSRDGHVRITDFGLARWLMGPESSGGIKGTPAFSSPEQIRGERLDEGADLYAVAAVGYFLLATHPPFGGGGDRERIEARMMAGPAAPLSEVPDDLRQVIEGMLTVRERQCFRTAAEMRDALEVSEGSIAGAEELADAVERVMASIEEFEDLAETETQVRRPRGWRRLALVAALAGGIAFMLRGSEPEQSPGVDAGAERAAELVAGESTSAEPPAPPEPPESTEAAADSEALEAAADEHAAEPAEASGERAERADDAPHPIDGVARKRSPRSTSPRGVSPDVQTQPLRRVRVGEFERLLND
jgi:serine/threonine-protein kinase